MYDPRQYYYHYYNPQQHYYYYNDPKYREYYKYMQKHYQQVGNHVQCGYLGTKIIKFLEIVMQQYMVSVNIVHL